MMDQEARFQNLTAPRPARQGGGERLYLIDALGPFFAACPDGGECNWSKVPFSSLETDGRLRAETADAIVAAFELFAQRVAALGYTAVTLDDLAHLAPHSFYPARLKTTIDDYRALYRRLFTIARTHGLDVFITTDVMFFNEAIERHTRGRDGAALRLLARTVRELFRGFSEVRGVVVRIGESDGIDVEGAFQSRLAIKTVRQCRRYIRSLLPLFERFDRLLVVRTWSLGAFEIGDVMWNPTTYRRVFGSIHSHSLIVSHKFGETDFFRYLNLNPLFFESGHRKIVELQTRREYEGFGEFPSFVGFDYERYARYLSECEEVTGIMVWCQTGGWTHLRRLTYLRDSSVWTELNTFVALRIFKEGMSAEEAAIAFAAQYLSRADPRELITLLRLADQVIKELWYIPEFAQHRMYFRRTRVPPLLWIFWDNIVINHTMRKVIRRFVHERKEAIHDGYRMLHKIRAMKEIGARFGIDGRYFDFQYDTFRILATAREYYLGPWDVEVARRIERLAAEYAGKYPEGFHVLCDFSPVRFKKWMIKTIFRLSLRSHPHYRLLDRYFLIRFASLIYPLVNWWQRRRLPDFAREQAMGIQVLFR